MTTRRTLGVCQGCRHLASAHDISGRCHEVDGEDMARCRCVRAIIRHEPIPSDDPAFWMALDRAHRRARRRATDQ